jgi:hypothetical protein
MSKIVGWTIVRGERDAIRAIKPRKFRKDQNPLAADLESLMNCIAGFRQFYPGSQLLSVMITIGQT